VVAGDTSSYVCEVCRDLELDGVLYGVSVGDGKAYVTSDAIVLSGTSCICDFVSTEVSIIIDLRPPNLSANCRTVPMLALLSNIPQASSSGLEKRLECRVALSLPVVLTEVAFHVTWRPPCALRNEKQYSTKCKTKDTKRLSFKECIPAWALVLLPEHR